MMKPPSLFKISGFYFSIPQTSMKSLMQCCRIRSLLPENMKNENAKPWWRSQQTYTKTTRTHLWSVGTPVAEAWNKWAQWRPCRDPCPFGRWEAAAIDFRSARPLWGSAGGACKVGEVVCFRTRRARADAGNRLWSPAGVSACCRADWARPVPSNFQSGTNRKSWNLQKSRAKLVNFYPVLIFYYMGLFSTQFVLIGAI